MDKKISLPEIIFMSLLVLSAYLFGVLADLAQPILGLGQMIMVLDWVYDGVVFAVVQLWLIFKGGIGFGKQVPTLIGNLAAFVPLVNVIPLDILGFFVTVYLVNHPKIAAVAESLTVAGGAATPGLPQKQKEAVSEELPEALPAEA